MYSFRQRSDDPYRNISDPEWNIEDDNPEEDASDLTYRQTQIRPSWDSKVYPTLQTLQTKDGILYCGVCDEEIELESNGNEKYPPDLKYKNQTRPHIDHYNPDWADRLKLLISRQQRERWDVQRYTQEINAAFNAKPLRIAHKRCNLTR